MPTTRFRGYEISKPLPILSAADPPIPIIQPRLAAPTPPTCSAAPTNFEISKPFIRPLSDIRESTEPSLIDAIARDPSHCVRHRRSASTANPVRRRLSQERGSAHKDDEPTRRQHAIRQTALEVHTRTRDPSNDTRHRRSASRASSVGRNLPRRTDSAHRRDELTTPHASSRNAARGVHTQTRTMTTSDDHAATSSSYSSTPEVPGAFTIPQSSVPRRSSSTTRARSPYRSRARKRSVRAAPSYNFPSQGRRPLANRGDLALPIKNVDLRLAPIASDATRRVLARTHDRIYQSSDILEFPTYKHPRVKLELQVSASIFVGGGSVEGFVRVTVDDNERLKQRTSLGIGTLSVDLVGYEEASGGRRAMFLALGTEIIDAEHPPPPNMAQPANSRLLGDKFWTMSHSDSTLPFMISLPLDTGPPPFYSKPASVRFTLCTTALIRDAGKHYRIRCSQPAHVLPTFDPERALTSLSSPLTASDDMAFPRASSLGSLKVTAALHRQVWVSGSTIFVDVKITNQCHKPVKRLELSLERNILCYKHSAASTREKSAGQARIFDSKYQTLVTTSVLRNGTNGWTGVEPHTAQTRTCDLEVPRGHATVRCGKYFEVRYFLNIAVSVSNTKVVSVQLPIILIHMNSLDVIPNSVAQVAAAMEDRRAFQEHRRSSGTRRCDRMPLREYSSSPPVRSRGVRRQPSFTPGRAFSAPRQQSLDRQRAHRADMEGLQQELDSSPRKFPPKLQGLAIKKVGSNISFGNLSSSGRSIGKDSAFRAVVFSTPEAKQPMREPVGGAESVGSIRERMRRMASFNSRHSKRSASRGRSDFGPWKENANAHIELQDQPTIAAHALGLSSASEWPDFEVAMDSASRGHEFSERQGRVRFEFKGVNRKPSGGLRERGMNWLEQMRQRGKEKDAWI